MSLEYVINRENTVNLKEIFNDGDPESTEEYEWIEACVRCYLFSRFEERKQFGLKKLRAAFNPNLKIYLVKENNLGYAYISLTKDRAKFLYIETYNLSGTLLEEVPTKEDLEKLSKFT